MNDQNIHIPAIACDFNAIKADEREGHETTVRQLFAAVQGVQELPNGYAFRLPTDSAILMQAADFIANQSLCCPFFRFTLEIEPDKGPVWLKLSGADLVKEFISAEVMTLVNADIRPG